MKHLLFAVSGLLVGTCVGLTFPPDGPYPERAAVGLGLFGSVVGLAFTSKRIGKLFFDEVE